MQYLRKLQDNILCTIYYKEIMNGQYYYVLSPLEKKVYFVEKDKFDKTVDKICEKLFKRGYLQGKSVNTTPKRLRPIDYARTLAHYAGVEGIAKEGIAELIFLPLLDECECAPSTKEFFLILLDKYITGEISPVEMVKKAIRRFLKLSKNLKIYKVKFY